jgi:hypothetical protein
LNNAKLLIGDKGYIGQKKYNETQILTLKRVNSKSKDVSITKIELKHLNRRSDIEEIISHLKTDFKLGRNYFKGKIGDIINPILSASASNFKLYARKARLICDRNRFNLLNKTKICHEVSNIYLIKESSQLKRFYPFVLKRKLSDFELYIQAMTQHYS